MAPPESAPADPGKLQVSRKCTSHRLHRVVILFAAICPTSPAATPTTSTQPSKIAPAQNSASRGRLSQRQFRRRSPCCRCRSFITGFKCSARSAQNAVHRAWRPPGPGNWPDSGRTPARAVGNRPFARRQMPISSTSHAIVLTLADVVSPFHAESRRISSRTAGLSIH